MGVLLREPGLGDRATLALARELAALLEPVGGWLGVHDRAHLAAAVGAAAVHLGFRSLPVAAAREVVGEKVALGISTHAGDGPALWEGADYRFFGPVFETPSKHGLLVPTGIEGLEEACSDSELPVWALGGLAPEHARAVRAAGAAGCASLGGILAQPDPARAVETWLEASP